MVSSNTDPITLNYANRIILNYAKYATSSLVNITGWDRVKFLEEEDFLDVFSRDFKVILRNQRLGSMKLEIEENQDYDLLDSLFYKEFSHFCLLFFIFIPMDCKTCQQKCQLDLEPLTPRILAA